MFSISNKHEEFYDYLMQNAEVFHQEAGISLAAMTDLNNLGQHLKDAAALENQADKTNKEMIRKLAITFITPIDREDFYHLSSQLKFCIDHLHGTIRRLENYHIKEANPAAIEVMQILVDMATEMKDLFGKLKSISRNEVVLIEGAEQLGTQERKIDHLYRAEISRLFDGSQELFDVIRWKDIMDTLENTSDEVEGLANIIKEVTMKYA